MRPVSIGKHFSSRCGNARLSVGKVHSSDRKFFFLVCKLPHVNTFYADVVLFGYYLTLVIKL